MGENRIETMNHGQLRRREERLSKKWVKEWIETGKLFEFEIGTFKGLADIHYYLFQWEN